MADQSMSPHSIHAAPEAIKHPSGASRLGVSSTYELIRKVAADDPERTAIALPDGGEGTGYLSYQTLLKTIHQVANLLVDLGVGRRDVIALLLPHCLETQLLLWGGQASGIVCPVSPWLPGEQLTTLLGTAKVKVLAAAGGEVSQDLWQKAEVVRRQVKTINAVLQVRGPGEEREGVYAFDALLPDYPSDRLQARGAIAADEVAISFHIRDTNGTSRLMPVTHGGLLKAGLALSSLLRLTPEETLLRSLPHFIQAYW